MCLVYCSHNTLYFWSPNVEIFPHTKQFSHTSWMSYNLTQFWYSLPGDRVRSHRLRAQSHSTAATLLQVPIASSRSPGYHNFSPVWLQIGCLHDPHPNSFGFDYLWEELTELRETLMFVSLLYNKGCDKGYKRTARWREEWSEVWKGPKNRKFWPHGVVRCVTFPAPPCVYQPRSSLKHVLLRFITEAWFITTPFLVPFPFLENGGCGWKS